MKKEFGKIIYIVQNCQAFAHCSSYWLIRRKSEVNFFFGWKKTSSEENEKWKKENTKNCAKNNLTQSDQVTQFSSHSYVQRWMKWKKIERKPYRWQWWFIINITKCMCVCVNNHWKWF